MRISGRTPYDGEFYRLNDASAAASASVLVPLVVADLHPSSVVDFGCGDGVWLSAFQKLGVTDLLGLDGAHVDLGRLQVARECFSVVDLEEPAPTSRPYDLALSLEVAEHVSPAAGTRLVEALCRSSRKVLFSGAVPGQGGTHHINEQWVDYWVAQFSQSGFVALDVYRPKIAYDLRVAWWYRQNLMLFVGPELEGSLREQFRDAPARAGQEWVHIETVRHLLSVRSILRILPRSSLEALSRRVRRLLD
jgi:hypothetical protein